MATAINLNAGKNASAPMRVVEATIDLSAVATYLSAGHADTALSAALEGMTFRSIPMACTNGTTVRYAKVNVSTKKVHLYSDVACATETTSGTSFTTSTIYSAIPILVVGQ